MRRTDVRSPGEVAAALTAGHPADEAVCKPPVLRGLRTYRPRRGASSAECSGRTWLLYEDVLGPIAAKGSVANRRERRYLARPRL